MIILGISAYYHDSAAAILRDGVIVAAAQEERFSRIKFDNTFPAQAARYCLEAAGCTLAQVDVVVFYEAPDLKLSRLLNTYVDFFPRGAASFLSFAREWAKGKFFLKRMLRSELRQLPGGQRWPGELAFGHHHESHAASAFYPSPFAKAGILTVDGMGEWDTTAISVGEGAKLQRLRNIEFPHSLGMLYSAFTAYGGLRVNSDEYKLMGLAPYGEPKYAGLIRREIIDIRDDGSFRLNLAYFDFMISDHMVSGKFCDLFGGPIREKSAKFSARDADLAASVQQVIEEIMLRLVKTTVTESGSRNLCLAGGVALNCVANGKILRSGLVDRLWIQPAAGDAGSALGAALAFHHTRTGKRDVQEPDSMNGSRLGPGFSTQEIVACMQTAGARFEVLEEDALVATVARALAAGEVVGWFDGRMEFGPRALGGRSILADPRRPDMQRTLNMMVKFRESFRPFAPIVLREDVAQWFDLDADSPYMLLVAQIAESRKRPLTATEANTPKLDSLHIQRSTIPAVTHVDYSARVQTVDTTRNPRLHALLEAFKALTGCPVLVNTSFNVADEPVVCTPDDAFRCFMGTDIDALAMGNVYLRKRDQNTSWTAGGAAGPARAAMPEFNYTVF